MSQAPRNRHRVFWRDQWRCRYCDVQLTPEQSTIDHVLPRSRGGKSRQSNLVTACRPCNGKKDNRTPEEAGMTIVDITHRTFRGPPRMIKQADGGGR